MKDFEPRTRICPFLDRFHNMFEDLKDEDPDLNPFAFAVLKGETSVLAVARIEYFDVQQMDAELGKGRYASIAYLCGRGSGSGTKLMEMLIDLHRKKGFIVRVASLDSAKGYWRRWTTQRRFAPREVVRPSLYMQGRDDSKFYWGHPVDLSKFLPE